MLFLQKRIRSEKTGEEHTVIIELTKHENASNLRNLGFSYLRCKNKYLRYNYFITQKTNNLYILRATNNKLKEGM